MGVLLRLFLLVITVLSALLYIQPPLSVSAEYYEYFLKNAVFAPSPEIDDPSLVIDGVLPEYLVGGIFLRVGPNPIVITPGEDYHWFDGDGMVWRTIFNTSTTASVRSRQVRTVRALDGTMSNTLGSFKHPWKFLASMLKGFIFPKPPGTRSTANTALLWWQKRLFALEEGDIPYELDPVTLETLGTEDFGGGIGMRSMTAHPKVDPETKELFFCSYIPPRMGQVAYMRAIDTSSLSGDHTITLPDPYTSRSVHDFGVSKHHVVWHDFPVEITPLNSIKGLALFLFNPEAQANLGWHPKGEPEAVQWLPIKTGYAFHIGNTWEEGDFIKSVGCRAQHVVGGLWDSNPSLNNYNGSVPPLQTPFLYQWSINTKVNTVAEDFLLDQNGQKVTCEFPSIDWGLSGLKSRFIYMSGIHEAPGTNMLALSALHSVIKYDLQTNTSVVFQHSNDESECGGEVFFVKDKTRPDVPDAGSLLTYVLNKDTNESKVAVINAETMELVASVNLGVRAPAGFHSVFISKESLQNAGKSIE